MSNSKNDGIGLSGVLLVVFVVLKLVGVIHWSWWWVMSPLWIPLLGILLIGVILTALGEL